MKPGNPGREGGEEGKEGRKGREGGADENQNQNQFIRSYFRPRRPLLRPYLVAVAEATCLEKSIHVKLILINKSKSKNYNIQ